MDTAIKFCNFEAVQWKRAMSFCWDNQISADGGHSLSTDHSLSTTGSLQPCSSSIIFNQVKKIKYLFLKYLTSHVQIQQLLISCTTQQINHHSCQVTSSLRLKLHQEFNHISVIQE
jgi:hypothetical protein